MKKARGSALIIAMLMIASIGSIAFGIARIVFLESNITTLHENSVLSYYAAESGIEEGFLRYRYSMNATVPFNNWYQSNQANETYYRTNLPDMLVNAGTGWNGIIPKPADYFDKAEQSYDLRMGYLGTAGTATYTDPVLGGGWVPAKIKSAAFGTGESSFLKIGKDENYKFDLSNYNFSNSFSLGLKFFELGDDGIVNQSEYCTAVAEVKFVTEDMSGNNAEYKALTSPNPGACTSVVGGGSLRYPGITSIGAGTGSNGTDPIYYYRYNDLIGQMLSNAGAVIPANGRYRKAELQIKPLFHPAMAIFGSKTCADGAACPSSDSVVTGPYTTIKSIGYYGGTTKTLTANIDRQSGTLYDLFDYVIYNNGI